MTKILTSRRWMWNQWMKQKSEREEKSTDKIHSREEEKINKFSRGKVFPILCAKSKAEKSNELHMNGSKKFHLVILHK